MNQRREQAWAKWRDLVSEQEQSGQSVAAFCRDRELARSQFKLWAGSWVGSRDRFSGKPKKTNGGRYRIRTHDFHRVKVARCLVIRELQGTLGSAPECSGAYFSKTYEHGPESWTHKWTHVKPGWHPVFFSSRFAFLAVAGLSTIADWSLLARWQLDPLQLPQVSTMKG